MRGGLQELLGASVSAARVSEDTGEMHEREEAAVEVRSDVLVGRRMVERRMFDDLGTMRRRPCILL